MGSMANGKEMVLSSVIYTKSCDCLTTGYGNGDPISCDPKYVLGCDRWYIGRVHAYLQEAVDKVGLQPCLGLLFGAEVFQDVR